MSLEEQVVPLRQLALELLRLIVASLELRRLIAAAAAAANPGAAAAGGGGKGGPFILLNTSLRLTFLLLLAKLSYGEWEGMEPSSTSLTNGEISSWG